MLWDGRLVAWGEPARVLTVENLANGVGVEAEALTCHDGMGVVIPRRSLRARQP